MVKNKIPPLFPKLVVYQRIEVCLTHVTDYTDPLIMPDKSFESWSSRHCGATSSPVQ